MSKYSALSTKYSGFSVPAYKITSGGSELGEFLIDDIMVDNGMGKTAGACRFTVNNVYEHGSRQFSAAALDKLKPGKQVAVSLGYGSNLTEVFTGYIDELNMSFNGGGYSLSASCLDARALMRDGAGFSAVKGKNIKDAIDAILDKYKPLVAKKTVTLAERETGVSLTQAGNDLDYIQNAADLRGLYFYMECGTAYIGDEKSTVCVEFDWPQCEIELSVRHLEQKIVGIGYDYSKMKPFKTEKAIKGKQPLLSVTRTVHLPPHLLGDSGKDTINDMARIAEREAINGVISCRGIPEPKLGQKVKINKFPLASLCGNEFTVVSIGHRLDSEDGFSTEIGIGG